MKTRSFFHKAASLQGVFVLMMLAIPFALFAQNSGAIEGVIKASESGKGLPGVNVVLEKTSWGASTDASGRYKIERVPEGEYVLMASFMGREPVRRAVKITANQTAAVNLELAERAILLPNVVVSATMEAQSKAEVAGTIGRIAGNDIATTKPIHPSEIMQRVPGVWVNNMTGEGHMTAIRQPITTNPVYLFLEDGIPTRSTGFFNHNALYEINVPQAEAIEILKGPGTALYGSDAIGGVINASTKRPPNGPEINTSLEGGSFGFQRLLATGGTKLGANAFRVDANLTQSDGWRRDAPYDRQSGTLRWDSHLRENTIIKTIATYSGIEQSPAGSSPVSKADYENDPQANYTPFSYRDVTAFRLSSALDHFTASSSFNFTGYYRYNRMKILPNWTLFFDPAEWDSKNRSYGVSTKYRRDFAWWRSRMILGLTAERSPGSRFEQGIIPTRTGPVFTAFTYGNVQYDYDVTFQEVSPYLHAEFSPTQKLRFTGGLRYDALSYDYTNNLSVVTTGRYRRPASTKVDYTHLSPKAGATYIFSDKLNLFAAYNHAFRVPSESQVFRQGQTEDTIGMEPIKANSYEAGARSRLSNVLEVEVSLYQLIKYDDIVSFINADGTRENLNAGETRHRGVEVSLVVQPVRAFNINASVSVAKHTYEDWRPNAALNFTGKEIEFAPREIVYVVATYKPAFLKDGQIALDWTRIGKYNLDPDNLHTYAGHDVLNLRVNAPTFFNVSLFGRLSNITDELYAESVSYSAARGEEFAPGLPRAVYVGIQYHWGTKR